MHGRRADGGEGCRKRRPFLRHMWPATRVEAAPPPAKGPSSPLPRSSAPPLRTTSYPPAPTTPPASTHKEEGADSPRPASADSFIKDGREFRVGDCALFQAVDVPPFIGLIRWIEKKEEGFPRLRVSWLYRSADVKLNKGLQVNAAPNEIFYSFHQDETSAVSLLHPCKVAFLRKGVELPAGISSFVCRRVYDIDNKCLWWLTDRDYINEWQEEVNRLLHRTRLEMHAAVQSGGRSPKRLNGPSPQQKSGSDDAQSCGLSKGRKRDRTEQGIDPAKRDRERPLKFEDGELVNFKVDNMKFEIAKFADKDGLPHAEAVEKLVKCMQLDQIERKIDLAGRVMLADIIAATESTDCLGRFVQLRGLPILNEWLQETHKGKSGEGGSPRETDKPIEEFLLALLRALAKLPINLNALQSCSIGKSVNHLRSHKNREIQKKAKCLVENWKKRVDAEMKSTDAKPVLSGPAISWSGKAVFPEISSAGNGRSGSSEPSPRNPLSQLSSPKALSAKPGTDAAAKSNPFTSGSSKLQHIQPANVATNLKDPPCNSTGGTCGPDFPSMKEEKSCSSSQSLNNSQSCSSDHGKTVGPLKDDARRSTAASANASKMSGSSARGHRRSNNGLVKKEVGFQKEAALGRSSPLDHSLLQERSSQSGMACEKGGETLSDHVNSHRLIVRFPNPGRSPGRSTIGASCEDPSISGSRASSPVLADKHEQIDRRVKMKTEHSRPHLDSDANAEPAQSNHIEGATGSEEGDKSSCGMLDGDCSRTAEEAGKDASASQGPCSLYVNEKDICLGETTVRNSFNPLNALIEIKYSEASHSMQAGDDTAMNLLASVAGEVSRSELVMPSTSPGKPAVNELSCEGDSIGKLEVECDAGLSQHSGPSDVVEKDICEKEDKSNASFVAKEEQHLRDSGTNSSSHDSKGATSTRPSPLPGIDSSAVESSANTGSHEVECANKCSHIPSPVDSLGGGDQKSSVRQLADIKIDTQFSRNSSVSEPRNAWTVCEKVEDGCVSSSDQKHLLGLPDHLKITDRSTDSTAGKMVSKPSLSSLNEDLQNADGLTVKVPKEDEKKEQPCSTSADVTKLVLSAILPPGPANGNGMVEESKGSSSELSSHVKPRALTSPDNEHSARQSSKKLCDDVGGKEDLVSSDEGSSVAAKAKSNGTAKLDFDLNELGDEGNHSGPATSPVICSSAIHLPGLSPFVSPISSGLPAPITVAAPAKGPFVPPENLLRVKPDAGWKGSAATSAFRPAEPRKILGMFLTAPDTGVSDNAGKQSRPAFDIDLNVADDQVLEDDISQSSAQTIGSESGNSRSRNGRVQSAGIELDLNRADEVAENSQFISNASPRIEVTLLPARPLPGVPSNTGTNSSRNFFDLNNGPCLDEANTELAQTSLSSKSTSSIPFLPQVPGIRMNSAEMSNMSPWFASANSCAPVAMQSFLPARAEQPYPIDTAPGTQRFIAPVADGGQFRSDFCRAPVMSTSPTMVFHPPAYQYAGFPFTPSVHLPTTGFPMGSTSYANAAPAGVPYFPTIVPSHIGSTGVLPVQHARQYATNLTEGTSRDGHDSNWKWRRQGLDLNSGPGSIDAEGKDERLALSSRPNVVTPPQAFVEEQTRMYQMSGVGIERKEPEGSWDAERSSSYKQLSWQ